jgi:hypothetical protein
LSARRATYVFINIDKKMGLATFWVIFSETNLVTLKSSLDLTAGQSFFLRGPAAVLTLLTAESWVVGSETGQNARHFLKSLILSKFDI